MSVFGLARKWISQFEQGICGLKCSWSNPPPPRSPTQCTGLYSQCERLRCTRKMRGYLGNAGHGNDDVLSYAAASRDVLNDSFDSCLRKEERRYDKKIKKFWRYHTSLRTAATKNWVSILATAWYFYSKLQKRDMKPYGIHVSSWISIWKRIWNTDLDSDPFATIEL